MRTVGRKETPLGLSVACVSCAGLFVVMSTRALSPRPRPYKALTRFLFLLPKTQTSPPRYLVLAGISYKNLTGHLTVGGRGFTVSGITRCVCQSGRRLEGSRAYFVTFVNVIHAILPTRGLELNVASVMKSAKHLTWTWGIHFICFMWSSRYVYRAEKKSWYVVA